VSRQTVYRWLAKYEEGGLEALADESHRPHHVPHQMGGVLEVRVLDLRERHPLWGPKGIQFELKRAGVDPPPSHMAIYRALVRSGLIVKGATTPRSSSTRSVERTASTRGQTVAVPQCGRCVADATTDFIGLTLRIV
jgi:transposase